MILKQFGLSKWSVDIVFFLLCEAEIIPIRQSIKTSLVTIPLFELLLLVELNKTENMNSPSDVTGFCEKNEKSLQTFLFIQNIV